MSIEGVDYSFARPTPSGLAAAGKKFAVRYGGPGSAGKHLTASELKALRAAGLDVVANAEGSAGGYKGDAAGRSWAASAENDFRGLGMGADRPIYFSVDWPADSSDWAAIDAALHGSAAILGANRVGVYGSYDVIAHCVVAGSAKWFWQTYAWSHGRQHPKAHLYQYSNGVTIAGGDCDLTRALTADFGQWNKGGYVMPTNKDMLDTLAEFFATGGQHSDGSYSSRIGRDAFNQDLPNPFNPTGVKTEAWRLMQNTAMAVQRVEAVLKTLTEPAALATAIAAALVPTVVAELRDAGAIDLTEEQVQAASERATRKVLGAVDNA